jgi:methylated-DNA-[protein]-cysteine S-methyltransferase
MNAVLSIDLNSKTAPRDADEVAVFPTALGWIAVAARQETLLRLVFGYADAQAAREALAIASKGGPQWAPGNSDDVNRSTIGSWPSVLTARLKAYAAGQADDFANLAVWSEDWSPFQRRVLDCCRRIPYGQTRTYAELAILAGSPGAARAVGRTMATNPIPLVIPCHRVVGSAGDLRGYSAFGGLAAKRRLLALERGGAMGAC